ncbi:hypothetical protein ACS0TY_002061 [Phlomoides rotata]
MSSSGSGGDAAELGETLKEGERILASTRRPDGTLRKPIRIRAGYSPQDEVAVYQSKGALWKKEMTALEEVPPGYDPVVESKPKSKSAKRNERKKEKRQQAALGNGENSEQNDVSSADNSNGSPKNMESVLSKMNELSLSGKASLAAHRTNSTECPTSEDQDIDKKIRALKKKVNLLSISSNSLLALLHYFAQLTGLLSLPPIHFQINYLLRYKFMNFFTQLLFMF